MNNFVIGLLIGAGLSIIVLPLLMLIINKFRETLKRREIKIKLAKKEYLQPMDTKDYDANMWPDINTKENEEILKNLDENLFKTKEKMSKLTELIEKARKIDVEDEQIKEKLKFGGWQEKDINMAFEELNKTDKDRLADEMIK